MKLRIKYCGGCNPNIDRKKLVDEVLDKLNSITNVEVTNEDADVGIVVGGCSVSCVDLSEIEDQAKNWVIVGGNLVDYYQVSSAQLSERVFQNVMKNVSD